MELIKKTAESDPVSRGGQDSYALAVQDISTGLHISYTQTRTFQPAVETLKKNRVIHGTDGHPANNAYKMLRTHVLQRMHVQDWNTLAITSPNPGEGKTLTAVNLALSLAREVNHTVLLVDGDLRRPAVSRYFGYTPVFGLSDYLLDNVPLSEILFTPGVERLVVLPGGKPLDNSSEMLSSPKMVRLVEELKTRYPSRLVLFDMPPLLVADDLLAFSPYIDAALLVIEEAKTRKDELTRAMEMLQVTQVLGTVLNKTENTRALHY